MIVRFAFVAVALAWTFFTGSSSFSAEKPPVPNIVIFLADDMGFSDAGCYGGEIQTPNIDRLAAGGLRFTQFYNTARCWPSRAAILTGYYAQQVRRDALPGVQGAGGKGIRPRWARLLPEMLKPLGYRSYHSGKWHVDGEPLENGFDASFSYSDNNRHFLPAQLMTPDNQPLQPLRPGEGYYAATAIADHAIRQLREHAQKYRGVPFFEYVAFTEPHFPVQAPQEDIDLYRTRYLAGWDALRQERWQRMTAAGLINCALSKLDPDIIPSWSLSGAKLQAAIGPGEANHAIDWNSLTEAQQQFQPLKMAIHAAMVHRLDHEVGRVIEQLQAMGAWENTVIFVLSDNGASAEQMIRGDKHDRTAPPGSAKTFLCIGPGWASAANTPFRLHKSYVHEGGITTPLVVHWPAGIAARGALRQNPGHLIDLAPTILDLAGGHWPQQAGGKPVPTPPGKSLLPAFTHDGSVPHDYLWWFHEGNRALRVGNWKLVALAGTPPAWELYDLTTDRCESKNLAAVHPEKVQEMENIWNQRMDEFRTLALKDMPPAPAKKGKAKAKHHADTP